MTRQEITPEGSVVPVFVTSTQEAPASFDPLPESSHADLRRIAFQAEADPLFFQWQAGEGTEEAWLAKRAEIRERYPDQE